MGSTFEIADYLVHTTEFSEVLEEYIGLTTPQLKSICDFIPIPLAKDPSKAQHYCNAAQKSFEQYITLIGLSKENVLNTFSEKSYFIENGGLQYFHAGAIIYFEENGNGPAKNFL